MLEFDISQLELKKLIDATQFSMASQDVRYYLNGMLFESEGHGLRTVATDGHRLATCRREVVGNRCPIIRSSCRAKGAGAGAPAGSGRQAGTAASGPQQPARRPGWLHLHLQAGGWRFPDWRRVIPEGATRP